MKVAIVGAGLTGLVAAYELAKGGHEVIILEKEAQPGGQVSTFSLNGYRLEGFYHHIFRGDKALIQLIEELGLGSDLLWLPSRVGYFYRGRIYPFTTPTDLLRFSPLNLASRLRLGLVSLYLQRTSRWARFEHVTAQFWLGKYSGPDSYKVVWGPLLRGKFGDMAQEISMAWLWGRLQLRLGSRSWGQEQLGYLRGSFGQITDALCQQLKEMRGAIFLNHTVRRIIVKEGRASGVETPQGIFNSDAIIATTPSYSLTDLAPELAPDYALKLARTRYLSALCLVLSLAHPVTSTYWLNIGDPSVPFVATIEQTNFLPPEDYGGQHILYISNYLPSSSPLFAMQSGALLEHYLPSLRHLNPQFDAGWVKQYHLFKEVAAQPIVSVNYANQIPSLSTPIAGLFLANTTQIYPYDRGLNQAVLLGQKVAALVASKS